MSYFEKLYRTYECIERNQSATSTRLAPIFHTEQNANIVVKIKGDGEFVGVEHIPKDEQVKIIPCTDNSAGRSRDKAPHPLFDNLEYITNKFDNLTQTYDVYIKNLKEWCDSAHKNEYVCKVLKYLEKNTLIDDLNKEGFDKVAKNKKTFVVFEYLDTRLINPKLDENEDIRQSWINYNNDMDIYKANDGFCQIIGKVLSIMEKHPRRIRNGGDGSRLISSNKTEGFVYRGKFIDPNQVAIVSREASYKAHNALRWLLKNQGDYNDTQYIVAWAISEQTAVPSPLIDTFDFANASNIEEDIDIGTAEAQAKSLNKMINGYKQKLSTNELCIMAVDSAVAGTLAVRYYHELTGSDFLERLYDWHTNCAWQLTYSKDKKFYGAPAPKDICIAAYGKIDYKDPRLKMSIRRILPCIIEERPFPKDILEAILHRICKLYAFKKREEFELEFKKYLGIACALYRYTNKERNYQMALEHQCKSRDYLYGRLLAIADYLEAKALKFAGDDRNTNAMRIMQRFADHPFSSWNILHKALCPYIERLKANSPGLLVNIEKQLNEVHDLFDKDDFTSDKPLSGEYLLGYYCQESDFYTSKKQDETVEE